MQANKIFVGFLTMRCRYQRNPFREELKPSRQSGRSSSFSVIGTVPWKISQSQTTGRRSAFKAFAGTCPKGERAASRIEKGVDPLPYLPAAFLDLQASCGLVTSFFHPFPYLTATLGTAILASQCLVGSDLCVGVLAMASVPELT